MAARLVNQGHSTCVHAASQLGISDDSITRARIVLDKGTPEEIAAVEGGKLSVRTAVNVITCRNTSIAGRKNHAKVSVSAKGRNPDRIAKMRRDNAIWKDLRGALLALTSLPLPSDVARVIKGKDRVGIVKSKLSSAQQWLEEFAECQED
ncbi:hypothetical protein [Bradyrhizobium yuanmingense]|nr:hypothetical protein [Bradyrhizobium yuanmingense]